MPRRLLLAADIVRDVAHSCGDSEDAEALKSTAKRLDTLAKYVAERSDVDLNLTSDLAGLGVSIRRLAASLDPEAREPINPDTPMGNLAAG